MGNYLDKCENVIEFLDEIIKEKNNNRTLLKVNLKLSDSSLTRLIKSCEDKFDIKIKYNKSTSRYEITDNENYFKSKFDEFKSVYYRTILMENQKYILAGVNDNNKNMEELPRFVKCIHHKIVLKFKYTSYSWKNDKENLKILPLLIKEYLQRWYIIGLDKNNDFQVCALERINMKQCKEVDRQNSNLFIEDLNRNFKPENTNSARAYFKNIIGLNIRGESQKVKIWASAQQTPYLENLPFHESQKRISSDSKGSIFEYDLVVNYELKQWILFYGCQIKVLEPLQLKEEVKKDLEQMIRQYQ